MSDLRYEHVLSKPEHIWLSFWRTFFSQATLMFGPDAAPVQNNFVYRPDVERDNRDFDIKLVHEIEGSNIAQVPAIVLEDISGSQSGILLDQRQSWSVSPLRANRYRDLIQMQYAIHAVARHRAESRALAGIIWQALNVFKDVLYQCGIHQLMPRSISNTQQLRAAGDEDRVDTVISCPFWIQESWGYELRTGAFPEQFCFFEAHQERTSFVLGKMDITAQSMQRYIMSMMQVTDPTSSRYVLGRENLVDPMAETSYILGQAQLQDPITSTRFIRGHIRVAP